MERATPKVSFVLLLFEESLMIKGGNYPSTIPVGDLTQMFAIGCSLLKILNNYGGQLGMELTIAIILRHSVLLSDSFLTSQSGDRGKHHWFRTNIGNSLPLTMVRSFLIEAKLTLLGFKNVIQTAKLLAHWAKIFGWGACVIILLLI